MDLSSLPSSNKGIDIKGIHYYRNESGIVHTKKYNGIITRKGVIVDTEIIGSAPRFGIKQHSKSDILYYTKREISSTKNGGIFRADESILDDANNHLFCYCSLQDIIKLKKQIIEFGSNFLGASLDIFCSDSVNICTDIGYQKSSFIRQSDGSYNIPNYQNGMRRKHRTLFIMNNGHSINIIEINKWLLISCRTEDNKIILSFDYMYEGNWKSPKLNIGSCYDWQFSNHLSSIYKKDKK